MNLLPMQLLNREAKSDDWVAEVVYTNWRGVEKRKSCGASPFLSREAAVQLITDSFRKSGLDPSTGKVASILPPKFEIVFLCRRHEKGKAMERMENIRQELECQAAS